MLAAFVLLTFGGFLLAAEAVTLEGFDGCYTSGGGNEAVIASKNGIEFKIQRAETIFNMVGPATQHYIVESYPDIGNDGKPFPIDANGKTVNCKEAFAGIFETSCDIGDEKPCENNPKAKCVELTCNFKDAQKIDGSELFLIKDVKFQLADRGFAVDGHTNFCLQKIKSKEQQVRLLVEKGKSGEKMTPDVCKSGVFPEQGTESESEKGGTDDGSMMWIIIGAICGGVVLLVLVGLLVYFLVFRKKNEEGAGGPADLQNKEDLEATKAARETKATQMMTKAIPTKNKNPDYE